MLQSVGGLELLWTQPLSWEILLSACVTKKSLQGTGNCHVACPREMSAVSWRGVIAGASFSWLLTASLGVPWNLEHSRRWQSPIAASHCYFLSDRHGAAALHNAEPSSHRRWFYSFVYSRRSVWRAHVFHVPVTQESHKLLFYSLAYLNEPLNWIKQQ
jgi:hypothetical protein